MSAKLDLLAPRLRRLKLSGMLEAIAARAEEARTRELDPMEFLELLLDDELARREAAGGEQRIRRARFDELCDLRDFDFPYNPQIPKAELWQLAAGRYLEEHASVLLCGPTGVGKTFVAQALGVAACRQGRRVLFTKTHALLADLAGGRADGSWQQRLRRYLAPELLLVDLSRPRDYPGQGRRPAARATDRDRALPVLGCAARPAPRAEKPPSRRRCAGDGWEAVRCHHLPTHPAG